MADAGSKSCVFVGELAVICFDIDEVDVVSEDGGDSSCEQGGCVLKGGRNPDDGAVEGVEGSGIAHIGP